MSNVPQDVIDDAVAAGLLDENEHIKPMWFMPWSEAIVQFLQLRARRSNAEPVAKIGVDSCGGEPVVEIYCNFPDGIHELYTAPPDAGVAAGMTRAAEICEGNERSWVDDSWNDAVNHCAYKILSAIPAESKAALREVCMKVAREANEYHPGECDLEAIVNSVLEGKS